MAMNRSSFPGPGIIQKQNVRTSLLEDLNKPIKKPVGYMAFLFTRMKSRCDLIRFTE